MVVSPLYLMTLPSSYILTEVKYHLFPNKISFLLSHMSNVEIYCVLRLIHNKQIYMNLGEIKVGLNCTTETLTYFGDNSELQF